MLICIGRCAQINLDKMNKPEKTHLCNVYNKPRIKNKNRCHMTSLLCKINWNLSFMFKSYST